MKRYGFLSIALATALTFGCNSKSDKDVNAANPPAGGAVGTAGSEDHNVSNGDKDFVKDVASDGTAEVELGRMALDRAVNPDVKKFAQMMVDDHTKANEELTSIATQYNIPVPSAPDDKHNDLRDKLAKCRARTSIASTSTRWSTITRTSSTSSGRASTRTRSTSRRPKPRTRRATRSRQGRSDRGDAGEERQPRDDGLNSWAAKTYPVVKAHLDRGEEASGHGQETDDQLG